MNYVTRVNDDVSVLRREIKNASTLADVLKLFPRIKEMVFSPEFSCAMFQCAKAILLKMTELVETHDTDYDDRMMRLLKISLNDNSLKSIKSQKVSDGNIVQLIQNKINNLNEIIDDNDAPLMTNSAIMSGSRLFIDNE